MKIPALVLAAAVSIACAPAVAQTPPNPPNAPSPPNPQVFEQMRSRMEAIQRTERTQILASLTPQHRALLATIAGQLATSAEPDYDGAAKRLDSALSSGESQGVIRASQNARAQERSVMQSMRSQFPMPPNGPRFGGGGGRMSGGMRVGMPPTSDAGSLLLRIMLRPAGMFMMRTRMR